MIRKSNAGQVISGLLMSLVVGIAITVISIMLIATLISGEHTGESANNIMISITLFFSAAIAALTAVGKTKLQRLPACLAGAGTYFLGLILCGAMVFDGIKSNIGATLLVSAGGGLCMALLGRNKIKKGKYKLPKLPR